MYHFDYKFSLQSNIFKTIGDSLDFLKKSHS